MSAKKNILVVTYWGFNSPILNSYALPYVRLIKKNNGEGKLFLFTLTAANEQSESEFNRTKQKLAEEGITLLNFSYRPFGFLMAVKFFLIFTSLFYTIIKNRINFIHAWCTPGGAIGYVLSLLTGTTLILDSFEPHAESMVETKTWSKNSFAYRLLFKLEKLQLKRAQHVICAASGMIEYSHRTYGVKKDHYFVKPACVDLDLFSPNVKNAINLPELKDDDVVCVYVGKFGDIYLKQEVFDFFKVAAGYWGERFKVLLLTNHTEEEIKILCKNSRLDHTVVIRRFVSHHEVPAYMNRGDFGICPVRPVPTKKFCTPIKNGEYWAMGLPVVITAGISDDSDIIAQNNIGYVLKNLNPDEYANAVKKIDQLLVQPGLKEKIREIARKYRHYSIAERIYQTLYA